MILEVGKIYRVKSLISSAYYFKEGITSKEMEIGDIFTVVATNAKKIPKVADPKRSTWYEILHSDGQIYALWAPKDKDFLEEA